MRKILFLLLSCCAFVVVKSQMIGQGSSLEYIVMPGGNQVTASVFIEKLSADTVTFSWQLSTRSGRRGMLRKSIENAKLGYWEPPMDGEDIIVPDDHVFMSISRHSFNDLKQNGKMEFDGVIFLSTDNKTGAQLEINGKKLNAISAASQDGYSKIWIMDDPSFPLILKFFGNPYNVDVELIGIR